MKKLSVVSSVFWLFLTFGLAYSADQNTLQSDVSGAWRNINRPDEFVGLNLTGDYKLLVQEPERLVMVVEVVGSDLVTQSLYISVSSLKVDGEKVDIPPDLARIKVRKIDKVDGFLLGLTFLNTSPLVEHVYSWEG